MPTKTIAIKPSSIIAKVTMMSFVTLAPLVTNLVTIIFIRNAYGSEGVFALGSSGNILGVIVAVSAGCMILSMRNFAKLRAQKEIPSNGMLRQLEVEHSQALRVTSIAAVFLLIAISALMVIFGQNEAVHYTYLIGIFPWALLIPFSQVTSGVLQAFGLERKIFTAGLLTVLVQILTLPVLTSLELPAPWLFFFLGAAQSAVAISIYGYRLRLVRSTLNINLKQSFKPVALDDRWRGLVERSLAGSDGLVFMGFFAVLTYAAGHQSINDGAAIAIIVSIMRLLVIPTKQFGIVGGRMLLTCGFSETNFNVIRRLEIVFCLILAALVTVLTLWLLPKEVALFAGIMMVIQILTEPWSGIDFSLGKVIHSPRAMSGILFTVYLAIGIPAAVIMTFLGLSSALVIWGIAFSCRIIFLVGVQKTMKKLRLTLTSD